MAPENWEALYQQSPVMAGGNLFKKDDLLRHAIRRSTTEQGQRVNGFTSRYKGLKALEQLISDDSLVTDSSRDAWMLWQAFLYRSSLQESFADLHNELIEGWVKRFRTILEEARDMGEVSDTLDCEKEAWAVWIYSAGLGQQALLHPEQLPPKLQKRLIRAYLDKLRQAG